MDDFVITSAEGVRCVFRERMYDAGRLDLYTVALDALDFQASTGVSAGLGPSPSTFFARLAAQWTGWQGAESWHSMEGELSLAATCDRTGHVTLRVMIPAPTSSRVWAASASIFMTVGELDRLAARAAAFFADEADPDGAG